MLCFLTEEETSWVYVYVGWLSHLDLLLLGHGRRGG